MNQKQELKKLLLDGTSRFVVSIILLILVWRNSHWSIALSLTLIMIRVEIMDLLVGVRKYREQLEDEQVRLTLERYREVK